MVNYYYAYYNGKKYNVSLLTQDTKDKLTNASNLMEQLKKYEEIDIILTDSDKTGEPRSISSTYIPKYSGIYYNSQGSRPPQS